MPAKSKSQFRFMASIAYGGNKKTSMSKKAAKEYISGQSPEGLPDKVKKSSVAYQNSGKK